MKRVSLPLPGAIDLFVMARAISYFADALRMFVVPVLVFARTGSAAMSGVALAVEYVPKIALAPLIGAWSQRFRLRPQFLSGEALRAGLCVLLLLAPSIELVMLLSALISVCSSYAYLLNESLVAVAFVGSQRTKVQARLQAADQLARAGGPALGAGLYVYCDFLTILAIAAALFLLCGVGLFALPRAADRAASTGHEGAKGGVRRGLRVLRRSPMLARLTFLMFTTNFASGVILATAPAMIAEIFGLPLHYFGVAASAAAAATAAVMLLIGRSSGRESTRRLGRRSLAAIVIALAMVAAAPNFIVFVAGYSLFTVANTSFATYMRVERLRFMQPNAVGETIGVLTSLLWLSVPFSGAVVAVLSGPLGLRQTLLIASLVAVLCVLVFQRGLAKADEGVTAVEAAG
jgi:MFS family permease